MPDVYTPERREAVKEAMNAAVVRIPNAPTDSFTIRAEVVGDGRSPHER
ncbi:MAG: hypothetical protein U0V73_10840 [Acidimicrobiia bacterium]